MTGQIPATPETVQRPHLRRLLQYWLERRGSRSMPSRRDIDPLHFPWMLGNVSLVEVHRGMGETALRYRFRLVGTRVVQRLGYDLTGKRLEELAEPQYRARLAAAYGELVHRCEPMVEHLNMPIDDHHHDYEMLRLPFSSDGATVDMLMLAVDFVDPSI